MVYFLKFFTQNLKGAFNEFNETYYIQQKRKEIGAVLDAGSHDDDDNGLYPQYNSY